MIRTTDLRGRFVVLALLVFAICAFLLYQAPMSHLSFPQRPGQQQGHTSSADLTGHAIAPKLGNATAKAELGRAAWKVLHTTAARFPEKPTDDEKEAFRSYIHLFQRLYPCGECAEHFGKVLAKYPPQASSRKAASEWLCLVHNVVNRRLGKEQYSCDNLNFDCGCADEEPAGSGKGTGA